MVRPLSLIVRSSLAVLAVGSLASAAEADGFHASGGVRVSGGFSARVHTGWRPRVWVGGYRPHYYYYPYYQPVPAYYTTVDTVAAPGVTQVVVAEPPLPRLGLGLFAGTMVTTDATGAADMEAGNFGLLGRFRLTPGLVLEGELSKTTGFTSVSVNDVDFTRVDRRVGAALLYEFGAHNRWSPYIVAGLGAETTDWGGQSSEGGYGEIGGGIRFAVTRHFHLTAELRGGARDAPGTYGDTPVPLAARTIYPSPTPTAEPEPETYFRSRFAAILCF